MAIDDLAGMAFGAMRFLYRVGSFCITVGLFLIVVGVFKSPQDFGVIPIRLIVGGFGIESILIPAWRARITGAIFIGVALMPTHFYSSAYAYLK